MSYVHIPFLLSYLSRSTNSLTEIAVSNNFAKFPFMNAVKSDDKFDNFADLILSSVFSNELNSNFDKFYSREKFYKGL